MNPLEPRLPERLPKSDYPVMDAAEFYRRYPPSAVVSSLAAQRKPKFRLHLTVAGTALAALALLVLLPWQNMLPEANGPFGSQGSVRDKGRVRAVPAAQLGTAGLHFQILRDGEFVPLNDGATLPGQSLLRFSYDSVDSDYLYLFGVDESGGITTYYPEKRGFSIPIARGRNIPLPDGILLDDYVGHERFFALFSNRPLTFVEIELAVASALFKLRREGKGLAELERLELDCAQASKHIVKR